MRIFGRLLLAISASALVAGAADAASILYRVDGVIGTDYLQQALNASGNTVTTISTNLSGQTLGQYDLVAYANHNSSQPGGDAALLASYLAGGGRVIYANWTLESGDIPSTASSYTGDANNDAITLGSLFSAGVGTSITAVNPGWGIFTTGLASGIGGKTVATFGNGEAAIVAGTNFVHNGFLTDTVDSTRLYSNQINYLLNGVSGAVPEPATWAMMIGGMGMTGGVLRRRRRAMALGIA